MPVAYDDLLTSVLEGNVRQVQDALSREGFQHNYNQNTEVTSALHAAIQQGNREMVLLLLSCGAGVRQPDQEGMMALHHAAIVGLAEMVELLLKKGSPVNIKNRRTGETPLHCAAQAGHLDTAATLIREGAHVNLSRLASTGETPLHLACKSGDVAMVRVLLSHGANVNIVTSRPHNTPLLLACYNQDQPLIDVLCKHGANVNIGDMEGQNPLLWAVRDRDYITANKLLDYDPDLRTADIQGCTTLHRLATCTNIVEDDMSLASRLISAGCKLDALDSDGQTPLHHCAISGNHQLAGLLLSAGAQVNVKEITHSETPLCMTSRIPTPGRAALVQVLVNSGADVNIGDKDNSTALHNLQGWKDSSRESVLSLLLEAGSCVNAPTLRGYTALDRCVVHHVMGGRRNHRLLSMLVAAGAALQPMLKSGRPLHQSPLCWLTWHGCLPEARFLVEAGWDVSSEAWIWLPGKTPEAEEFLHWLRMCKAQPTSLWLSCRHKIRSELLAATSECDVIPSVAQLPLPGGLKKQLMFNDEVHRLETDMNS